MSNSLSVKAKVKWPIETCAVHNGRKVRSALQMAKCQNFSERV